MNKYTNGVNLDLWESKRNELYGVRDQDIYSALVSLKDFIRPFKELFRRKWSPAIISKIKNGRIKFNRSLRDEKKMALIAERVFHVPVKELFNDDALVPLNNNGAEMFWCDLCGELDVEQNLRKTDDGRGRHASCEAEYRRHYRNLKKHLGMSTGVLRKMKKKRDALLPNMALTLEGLIDLKVNVLKVLEYIDDCDEPDGLFLPIPGKARSILPQRVWTI